MTKTRAVSAKVSIKVLHLGYGARGGGVGRVISDVAIEMQHLGFQCTVVFWGVLPAFVGYTDPLEAARIRYYDVVKTPGFDLRSLRTIAGVIRSDRPQVIVSHNVPAGVCRPLLQLISGMRTRWILVDHDAHFCDSRIFKIKYALGAAFGDCISFVSTDCLQAAARVCGTALRAKRCVVVPNGVNVGAFRAVFSGSDQIANLTMVGQFSHGKDQATLLRAFAIVRARARARLWLVGDGLELALSGLASALGVERDVTFWGFQDGHAVQDLLSKTTVYCFSSRAESFGLSVLEAMAAGLPVVACNVAGVRTLITHGVSGLLARPNDPDDLACYILRCLEDPVLRARLGQAARARAVADFSIQRCAAAYGELVMQLA